jgi:phthalate 4,5-dioxygenase oxygenase subunit
MLTKEDNDLLTQVGPGTRMGKLMRQYWVPALRSAKLVADGAPIRVRLLGENFVAFRATDGRVGFIDEACPHRGVSLALARNEDCALTCIFHGWKIDTSGTVIDTPSEPGSANIGSKIRVNQYSLREAGGFVWVWLGQGEVAPFPEYEFNNLPAENVDIIGGVIKCNWLQMLEGAIDSAHVTTLHKSWLQMGSIPGPISKALQDPGPVYDVEPTEYGFHAAAIRKLGESSRYIRVTEFVAPWAAFIPGAEMRLCIIQIPIDDENTTQWYVHYSPDQPLVDVRRPGGYKMSFGADDPNRDDFYGGQGGFDNMWNQDREAMKNGNWTGISALFFEDFILSESQGPIADRTKEKLGKSDIAIITARKLLIKSAEEYSQGKPAFGVAAPLTVDFEKIVARNLILDKEQDWHDFIGEDLVGKPEPVAV